MLRLNLGSPFEWGFWVKGAPKDNHESLKAYLAPTGLVSEPRGDLTCKGDLRLEVLISVPSVGFIYFYSIVVVVVIEYPLRSQLYYKDYLIISRAADQIGGTKLGS